MKEGNVDRGHKSPKQGTRKCRNNILDTTNNARLQASAFFLTNLAVFRTMKEKKEGDLKQGEKGE